MSEIAETTHWTFYDPASMKALGGNYIFLLRTFDNAPYYSGEAGNFADRFDEHKKLFAEGGRTFMRPLFSEGTAAHSHRDFLLQWEKFQASRNDPEQKDALVWVPDRSRPEEICVEGSRFWSTDVARLVFVNSYGREQRQRVESRIQQDIIDYYELLAGHTVDWSIPPRSRLMGPGILSEPSLKLMYSLSGGEPTGSGAFFRKLGDER